MIKTIKTTKHMTFRELMEYILENDIRDRVFRCSINDHVFRVCEEGTFEFYCENYDLGETYEVEVEKEITEDTMFEYLIEVDKNNSVYKLINRSINGIKDKDSITFYIPINGELVKIWEQDSDE